MVKTYSLYDSVSGLFTGKQVRCDEAAFQATQLPVGILAIEGAYDHLSQKVEIGSGRVVLHEPRMPSHQHEWIAHSQRAPVKDDGAPEQRHHRVLEQIRTLEISQSRALREATLGDAAAFQRLKEIDDAIKLLRRELL